MKDGQIKPGPGSPFAIEVFTAAPNADPKKPHKISDYGIAVPKDEDGLAFVKIDRGHVYGIQITNTADFDAAVSLNIDGLSMFVACDKDDPASKKKLRDDKGQPLHNFIVVEKGKKVFIQGWFVNLKETDEFLVTEYAKSLSAQFQAPSAKWASSPAASTPPSRRTKTSPPANRPTRTNTPNPRTAPAKGRGCNPPMSKSSARSASCGRR